MGCYLSKEDREVLNHFSYRVASLTATRASDGWVVKITGLSDIRREQFHRMFSGKFKEIHDLEEGITLITTPNEQPSLRRTVGLTSDDSLPMGFITQYLGALYEIMYYKVTASHSMYAPEHDKSTTVWTLQR